MVLHPQQGGSDSLLERRVGYAGEIDEESNFCHNIIGLMTSIWFEDLKRFNKKK